MKMELRGKELDGLKGAFPPPLAVSAWQRASEAWGVVISSEMLVRWSVQGGTSQGI